MKLKVCIPAATVALLTVFILPGALRLAAQDPGCDGTIPAPGCNAPPIAQTLVLERTLDQLYLPASAMLVDLDDDEDLDLVWIDAPYLESISLLRNRGGGDFDTTKVESYGVGRLPRDLVAADFDGDGDTDLAVSRQYDREILVLENRGAGLFVQAKVVGVDGAVDWFRAGDLDGDGDPDFAAQYGREIELIENLGGFGFADVTDLELPRHKLGGIAMADLDGDKADEIVVNFFDPNAVTGVPDATVYVFYNDLGWRFTQESASAVPGSVSELTLADMNGDHFPDFIGVSRSEFKVNVALNLGTGAFGELKAYPNHSSRPHVTPADLDRDGDLDLLLLNEDGLIVQENGGDGSLTETLHLDVRRGTTLVAGDLDGDGWADLLLGRSTEPDRGEMFRLRQIAAPAFLDCNRNGISDSCELEKRDCNKNCIPDDCDTEARLAFGEPRYFQSTESPVRLAVVQLDDDRLPDIFTRQLEVLLNKGGEAFEGDVDGGYSAQQLLYAVDDLNVDARMDVAVVQDRTIEMFLGDGRGAAIKAETTLKVDSTIESIATADLNGDRHPDIVTGGLYGEGGLGRHLRVQFNDGLGAFTSGVNILLSNEDYPVGLWASDLDGDGDQDLAVMNRGVLETPGRVSIILGNGGGTFSKPVNYFIGSSPSSGAVGDVEGDGDMDLVFAAPGDSVLSILRNLGDGKFLRVENRPVEAFPRSIALTDIDLDGDLDVLYTTTAGFKRLVVLRNRGQGELSGEERVFIGLGSQYFQVTDLNGDALPDLVLDQGWVLNQSTPALSRDENGNRVPDSCEGPHFHRGDPNQDGVMDIGDSIFTFAWLFLGGDSPGCLDSADANGDNRLDIADGVYLLNYLFLDGESPPPAPGPPGSACGPDPDRLGDPSDPGCEAYISC